MNLSNAAESLNAILPLAVLVAWACALLLVDLFLPKERKGWTALLSAIGLLVSLVLTLISAPIYNALGTVMVINAGTNVMVLALALIMCLSSVTLSMRRIKRIDPAILFRG